jgi:hypothetical protein
MKKATLILILWLPTCLYAQELQDKNWILKLNATQFVDIFSYPTLQVAAERKINPWFSVNAEVGFQLYDFYKPDTLFLKSKGFKTSIEGRVYLPKLKHARTESNRGEVYMGLQLFYRQNQATDAMSYYPVNDSTKTISDFYGTKITAKGINLIFGYQISAGRFVLEPFAGVGMISRKVKNSDIEYDETKHTMLGNDLVPYFQGLSLEKSSGPDFNICTGFRIGYRF